MMQHPIIITIWNADWLTASEKGHCSIQTDRQTDRQSVTQVKNPLWRQWSEYVEIFTEAATSSCCMSTDDYNTVTDQHHQWEKYTAVMTTLKRRRL